jgi:hypothetical protein
MLRVLPVGHILPHDHGAEEPQRAFGRLEQQVHVEIDHRADHIGNRDDPGGPFLYPVQPGLEGPGMGGTDGRDLTRVDGID